MQQTLQAIRQCEECYYYKKLQFKTSSGFEYKIEESRLKNYELYRHEADLENTGCSLPKSLMLVPYE